jgi:hypothetical protein
MSGGAAPEFFYIFERAEIRKLVQMVNLGSCKRNDASYATSAIRSTTSIPRPPDRSS